jgi:dTMP kinase
MEGRAARRRAPGVLSGTERRDEAGGAARTGRLVTLEGIDGSGKSTQARLLADALRARGREVVGTREPGGSPGAEAIRGLLLGGEPGRWSPVSEALLFTAARRDHVERVVEPALAAGRWVVCDRFVDSTRVYQGASGRGELRALVDRLHAEAVGLEPDLTLILDVEPEAGLARAARATRFEAMGLDFQRRLRQGFLALAEEFPERCRVIDGSAGPEAVAARILEAVP